MYKKLILVLILQFQSLYSFDGLTIEPITPGEGDLKSEKELFVRSVLDAYKKLNVTVENPEQKLEKFFDNKEKKDFDERKDGVYFVRTLLHDKLVGYASYEETETTGEIYTPIGD